MEIVAYPLLANLEPWSEDCLFLDIQVPGKAIRGEVKNLPVLFWIFGGGYGKSCISYMTSILEDAARFAFFGPDAWDCGP